MAQESGCGPTGTDASDLTMLWSRCQLGLGSHLRLGISISHRSHPRSHERECAHWGQESEAKAVLEFCLPHQAIDDAGLNSKCRHGDGRSGCIQNIILKSWLRGLPLEREGTPTLIIYAGWRVLSMKWGPPGRGATCPRDASCHLGAWVLQIKGP